MTKPLINGFNNLTGLLIQEYERYLPTAFDESLTLLQKMNKMIQYLNEVGKLTNDVVAKWNEVMLWLMDEGLDEAVIKHLDEMLEDGSLQELVDQLLFSRKATKIDASETITLYVSPSGDDTNDGTATNPFKTTQAAIDYVKQTYSVIDGNLIIDLAEGVYQGGIYIDNLPSKKRIQIAGKTFSNGVPSVIIDGSTNETHTFGISFNREFYGQIKNVSFQNFRNTDVNDINKCGINVQTFSDLLLTNVNIKNCGRGVFTSSNSRLYVEGGIYENCAVGLEHYASCVFYIGYNGIQTIVKNCNVSGVRAFHQTEGHIDYGLIDGNDLGIDIKNSSRVQVYQSEIKNNRVGVYCVTSSTWFNNGNTFSTNTKDIQYGTFSNELSDREFKNSFYRLVDGDSVHHTGSTSLTILKTLSLPKNALDNGNLLKIKVFGTFDLSTGNTCSITQYLGGTNIYGSTSVDGSTNKFEFEWEIMGKSNGQIVAKRKAFDNDIMLTNNFDIFNYVSDIVLILTLRVQLSSASDSVNIEGMTVEHIYG